MLIQALTGTIYDIMLDSAFSEKEMRLPNGHQLTLDLGGEIEGSKEPVIIRLDGADNDWDRSFIENLSTDMDCILYVKCIITGLETVEIGGDILTGTIKSIDYLESPLMTRWRRLFNDDYENDLVEELYDNISLMSDRSFENIGEHLNKHYDFSFSVCLSLAKTIAEFFEDL